VKVVALLLYSCQIFPVTLGQTLRLKEQDNWQPEIYRILNECNRIFQERFEIRLNVKELEYWKLEAGRCSLGDALCDLRKKILPKKCDVILGLTSDKAFNDNSFGISSYYNGYILIKHLESKKLLTFALMHELCHIFGASDIYEIGSIMDTKVPILNFDEFTTQIIRINRNRSFQQDSFPLSESQLGEAICLLKQRSELNRGEPGIHKLLALMYLERHDLASATHACNNALRFSTRKGQLHNILGNILRQQEQYDRALEEYQTALENLPKMPEIHFNMGEVHSKKGEVNKAIAEYKKAIQLNPHYSRAHASLSHLCFKEQRYVQAIKRCRTALEFCPYHTELLCTLAASLILRFEALRRETSLMHNQEMNENLQMNSKDNTNDLDKESLIEEALVHSTKATEIAPELSEAYNLTGVCYTYQSKFAQAEKEFLEALELNPNFVQAHYNLGYLYFHNNQMKKTAYHLKRIIESSYNSEIGVRLMARLFQNQSGCLVSPEQ